MGLSFRFLSERAQESCFLASVQRRDGSAVPSSSRSRHVHAVMLGKMHRQVLARLQFAPLRSRETFVRRDLHGLEVEVE